MRKCTMVITIVIALTVSLFLHGYAEDYFYIRAWVSHTEKDHMKISLYFEEEGSEDEPDRPLMTYEYYTNDVVIKIPWPLGFDRFTIIHAQSQKLPIILWVSDKEEQLYFATGGIKREAYITVAEREPLDDSWEELWEKALLEEDKKWE